MQFRVLSVLLTSAFLVPAVVTETTLDPWARQTGYNPIYSRVGS